MLTFCFNQLLKIKIRKWLGSGVFQHTEKILNLTTFQSDAGANWLCLLLRYVTGLGNKHR